MKAFLPTEQNGTIIFLRITVSTAQSNVQNAVYEKIIEVFQKAIQHFGHYMQLTIQGIHLLEKR